jgi:ABC-type cobalamin transport system ATPase subunit
MGQLTEGQTAPNKRVKLTGLKLRQNQRHTLAANRARMGSNPEPPHSLPATFGGWLLLSI